MALKANEVLDLSNDDDSFATESEDEAGRASYEYHGSKRRKVGKSDDDDEESVEDSAASDNSPDEEAKSHKLKPLSKEGLEKSALAVKNSGVVYLSRIPPYMKPQKMRYMLQQYGDLGRVFLSPEDPKTYTRRVRSGGNKRQSFDEGWVEFKDKKRAKFVAETLNGKPMGGNKRSFYHDDIWNIKYLHKFKWHSLTEQIALENASRQARLRADISQATRQNKTFLRNVERAKMIEGIKRKKEGSKEKDASESVEMRRNFRQREVHDKRLPQPRTETSSQVRNVHHKIFG